MIRGAGLIRAFQICFLEHTNAYQRLYAPHPTYRISDSYLQVADDLQPLLRIGGGRALVVPMSVQPEQYAGFLSNIFNMTNIIGSLVTMPHKVTTIGLLDELSITARIAGACNAVIKREDGSLYGDMFDGEGFVRGMLRKGFHPDGARALVVGSGGVGSAIAASLAAAGVEAIMLVDSVKRLVRLWPHDCACTIPR